MKQHNIQTTITYVFIPPIECLISSIGPGLCDVRPAASTILVLSCTCTASLAMPSDVPGKLESHAPRPTLVEKVHKSLDHGAYELPAGPTSNEVEDSRELAYDHEPFCLQEPARLRLEESVEGAPVSREATNGLLAPLQRWILLPDPAAWHR